MPERSGSAKGPGLALGWVVSIALHASVIGAGTALVWSIQQQEDEPYATDATTVVFQSAGLTPEPARTSTAPEPEATTSPIDALFEPRAIAPAPVMLAPADFDFPPASVDDAVPDSAAPLPLPEVRREAEFFGSGASDAKRVVYVVDASGSSIALFPAIAKELERSLHSLNATQKATVIAALGRPANGDREASGIVAMAGDALVRTTTRGAQRLSDWFATEVTPSGRSDLLLALERALAMEPDAVFLLASPDNASSNRDGFLSQLDALNPIDERTGRRRAIIGVVSVGPPSVGDPLTEIARLHGEGAGLVILERSTLLEGAR